MIQARSASRRGFTVAEVMVGAVVFMMIISMLYSFYLGAANSSGKTVEASDAMRSVLLASEFIRSDLSRLLLQKADDDLVIVESGRGLSFRIAQRVAGDPWTVFMQKVEYHLVPVPGSRVAKRLVRWEGDPRTATAISGCLLEDIRFQSMPARDSNPTQLYLGIKMVGLGSTAAKCRYTGSIYVPVNLSMHPGPYILSRGGES
jgi:hypothetical protein